MGCDIHFYVEKRVGGVWQSADEWRKGEEGGYSVDYKKSYFHHRSYDTFSILADVRNGRGFAEVVTGDGFVPVVSPRGLPKDVSDRVRECSEGWGSDGHSHSYLTVAELLAYDWTQSTTKAGFLHVGQYVEWQCRLSYTDGATPDQWCGDVGGGLVEKVSEAVIKKRMAAFQLSGWNWRALEASMLEAFPHTYVRCTWGVSYYASAAKFLSETMPRLWALGEPEDVRAVFWFDN